MKKRWLLLIVTIMLGLLLLAGGLLVYIAPDEELTMDYEPVKLEQKILDMVRNFKPEVVLNESDLNTLIKANMDRQLHEDVYVDGAHFQLADNQLYAKLNVTLRDAVKAEVSAVYAIAWEEPNLKLEPVALKLKNMNLPVNWLNEINVPIYDPANSVIAIESVNTRGNELIIKLKFSMFE